MRIVTIGQWLTLRMRGNSADMPPRQFAGFQYAAVHPDIVEVPCL
jgi:hypothetical protein